MKKEPINVNVKLGALGNKRQFIRDADALWLTKWYTRDASKEDSALILEELNRRIRTRQLKGEDRKIIVEFLKYEKTTAK